ncbi:MAG: SnoaL-like domain-containing protein [Saccharothrix sp.]|nr:SnoaL-like domain-containing protein [Saccharothrix sp.]
MSDTQGSPELSREMVLSFLEEFRKKYEKGDDDFFDCFTPDATFFTISSPVRIDSREEFKRSFGPAFGARVIRRSQFMAPEIRVLGGVVLVSVYNRVSIDGAITNLRGSYVIEVREGWPKITHLHNSPMPLPSTPAAPVGGARDLERISVLEERVASAAAQVGTPK